MNDTEINFWIEKKLQNQADTIAYLEICRRKAEGRRMTYSRNSTQRLPFLIEARDNLTDLFLERHLIEQAIGDLEGRDVKPHKFSETPLPSMRELSNVGRGVYASRPGWSSYLDVKGEISEWLWSLKQMAADYDYHYWKGGQTLKKLDTAIFMERWWGADDDHR